MSRRLIVSIGILVATPAAAAGNLQKYGECLESVSAAYQFSDSFSKAHQAATTYAYRTAIPNEDIKRNVVSAGREAVDALDSFLLALISLCDEMKPPQAATAP